MFDKGEASRGRKSEEPHEVNYEKGDGWIRRKRYPRYARIVALHSLQEVRNIAALEAWRKLESLYLTSGSIAQWRTRQQSVGYNMSSTSRIRRAEIIRSHAVPTDPVRFLPAPPSQLSPPDCCQIRICDCIDLEAATSDRRAPALHARLDTYSFRHQFFRHSHHYRRLTMSYTWSDDEPSSKLQLIMLTLAHSPFSLPFLLVCR